MKPTNKRNVALTALAAVAVLLTGGGARSLAAPPSADAIASAKIMDMTATITVKEVNRDELRKMGGAFGASLQYSVKRLAVSYKYPNRARFEGRLLGATLLMVYNGNQKMFRTPIKTERKNVYGQPGQKQSLMDIGIFARDYLATDYAPTYQRTERGLHVFKLSQRNTTNRSHEIVWVNPKTAIIERRLSYNGDNVFQKEMRYTQAIQVRPGIWVPSRVEIYNKDGKMAVAQGVEEIKVNLGVDDSTFAI